MRKFASGLALLVLGTTILRMVWAGAIGLGTDESYHFLYTVHPALSYFDHPPMVARVAELGQFLTGGSTSPLAVRLGFILLFAGSTVLMATLTARFFGPRAGLIAASLLNVTAYYSAAAGCFVLPDGPLLFFWLLTLDRLAVAIENPDRRLNWLAVGAAWGCSLLSKYHGILLVPGACAFLCMEPGTRRALRKAWDGPLLALVTGAIVFSPVLFWNAGHQWASFLFQGGRAVASEGMRFRPEGLIAAIGGPIAYLLPWVWLPLVVVSLREARLVWSNSRVPARDRAEVGRRFLLAMAVVPIGLFTAVGGIRSVLPHWSLIGYVCLLPMLGAAWADDEAAALIRPFRRIGLMGGAALFLAASFWLQSQAGMIQRSIVACSDWIPALKRVSAVAAMETTPKPAMDPSLDPFGWDQVAEELSRRGYLDRPRTFLFTGNWRDSGQLGYAVRGSKTPVLCYNVGDPRGFAFWSRSADWLAHDGILVSMDDKRNEPGGFSRWFSNVETICDRTLLRSGLPARRFRLFLLRNQRVAFPFDRAYSGNPAARLADTNPGSSVRQ